MAATECCICGKKIGRFDKSAALSPNLTVCCDCNNEVDLIQRPPIPKDNPMARHQQRLAIDHISEMISTGKADEVAVNLVLDIANEVNADEIKTLTSSKTESAKKAEEAEQRYLRDGRNILTTTSYKFDGYRIIDYHGVFSGDCVIGTGIPTELVASLSDMVGIDSGALANKLKSAKSAAMVDLVKQAMLAGGNAIIGIEYDIYPYGSMLGVTISGTSVTIEEE